MAMSCAGRENNTHATDGCGLFSALLCGGCLHEITTPFFVSFDIFFECFFLFSFFFYLAAASHPAASSKAPKTSFFVLLFFLSIVWFYPFGRKERKKEEKVSWLALPFLRTFENVFFFLVVWDESFYLKGSGSSSSSIVRIPPVGFLVGELEAFGYRQRSRSTISSERASNPLVRSDMKHSFYYYSH